MRKIDGHREPETMKEKLFFWILAAVAVICGVSLLIWGQYNSSLQVFDAAFMRYNIDKVLEADSEYALTAEESPEYDAMCESGEVWLNASGYETRSFTASTVDSLYMGAGATEFAYTYSDNSSDKTVIILHGYNQSAADSAMYAPFWWDLGYNVIIPELRGHQEQESATTFGVWEKYDLFDLIAAEGLQDDKLIICARGIGAAAAIYLAADAERDAGIDLIVAESLYSDLKTLELEQLKRQFNLSDFLVGRFIDDIVRKGLGFDPADADLTKAAAALSTPVLFVCGSEDDFLGYQHTQEVYNTCASEKQLVVIPGARHLMVYALGRDEYENAARLMLDTLDIQ